MIRPGSDVISLAPDRNASGGQVIGSTARLRRLISSSGLPAERIRATVYGLTPLAMSAGSVSSAQSGFFGLDPREDRL
jgi:hypothetical protein